MFPVFSFAEKILKKVENAGTIFLYTKKLSKNEKSKVFIKFVLTFLFIMIYFEMQMILK